MEKTDKKRFMELHKVPDFMEDNLHYFYSEADMAFVIAFGKEKMTVLQIKEKFGYTDAEAERILRQAFDTFILNKEIIDGETYYSLESFYTKMDHNCKFHTDIYLSMPKELRDKLDHWCFEESRIDKAERFNALKSGEKVIDEIFLAYDEIDEYFSTAKDVRILTCNCRVLADNCDKPRQTCVVCDDSIKERTFGRTVSKDEIISIVKGLRKSGLMQSVSSNWRKEGAAHMCNCCGDCCYPLRMGQDMQLATRQLQMAVWDADKCTHCGVCVSRCNLHAFTFTDNKVKIDGKLRKEVAFNPEKCWGCTICLDTCKSDAISIVGREKS